jgi:sphingolipid C9-methyltransferase
MSVRVTDYPAIKNAPLVGLAEGNGAFNNYHFATFIVIIPYILKSFLPFVNRGGFWTYLFILILTALPTAVTYWTLNSMYGGRKNDKVQLPGRNIEEYITIKDPEMKLLYHAKNKIPMQIFHDAYFDGKIEFNGSCMLESDT